MLIGAMGVKAQNTSRRDSLLDAIKNFKLPNQTLQGQKLFKLTPKDSLLGRMQFFKFPGADSLKPMGNRMLLKSGLTHSPIDHMPIANLPYNSRMPVYKLRKTDNMPGSNISAGPKVQVVPQK